MCIAYLHYAYYTSSVLIFNTSLLKQALLKRGFNSAGQFCKHLGIHRNTLSGYLGGRSVLQPTAQLILDTLQLDHLTAFEIKQSFPVKDDFINSLNPIVDALVLSAPWASFVLFGSRAKGASQRYSDVDLGVVGPTLLSTQQWSDLRNVLDDASEDYPFAFDLVDLRRASPEFLTEVVSHGKFLGGSRSGWQDLSQGLSKHASQ